MIRGHRIEKREDIRKFLQTIGYYTEDNIYCTQHTFFRLSEKQRKVFKCENLKEFLLEKQPILVGIQYNNSYTAFYDYKENKVIRIILDIKPKEIQIVTFYIIDKKQLPRI